MKCKAIQSFHRDHLYLRISLLMGLFHNDCALFQRTLGLTVWFEYESDVNHMLRPSNPLDLNPIKHL